MITKDQHDLVHSQDWWKDAEKCGWLCYFDCSRGYYVLEFHVANISSNSIIDYNQIAQEKFLLILIKLLLILEKSQLDQTI